MINNFKQVRQHLNFQDKNDFYVIIVMRNIFLDTIKKDKLFLDVDNYDFKDTSITFEIDDNEKELIESLKWYEKELIEMSYDKSFHEIQRELNINYQFVRRILNKTKSKWQFHSSRTSIIISIQGRWSYIRTKKLYNCIHNNIAIQICIRAKYGSFVTKYIITIAIG